MELNNIKDLIKIFEQSSLEFLEVELENSHIKMKKPKVSLGVSAVPMMEMPQKTIEIDNKYTSITSPVVGIFYASPSPENPPFVQVGQKVTKGDVIGLIEAMKVMSEIKATADGTLREICVNNEQMVSFGDILMQIEE